MRNYVPPGSFAYLTNCQVTPYDARMAKKLRKEKVSDQLRRAIRDCGVSCYALSKIVNIDESTLSRFLAGERGLSMKALDRLGSFLDLEVIMHGPHATNPE